jgi:polysaccharide export outer membrane protein
VPEGRTAGVKKGLSVLFAATNIALVSAAISYAQKPLIPRHEPAMTGYVLGSGDEISIHVEDLDDITDKPIRINPDGSLDLPLIGRVEASGLTLEELRASLRSRLTRYIINPKVVVNLINNQSRTVSVVGAVNSPGVRSLSEQQHLVDVISMAGGASKDAGYLVMITRQARFGEIPLPDASFDAAGAFSTASVPLDDLLASKNPSNNVLIYPGDVISIPRAEIVYVLGTVKKAGGFPLATKKSMSLLHTLSLAEGFDRDAAPGKARILRPTDGGDGQVREIPVNLSKILKGEDPDVPLYPNDILYVPNSLTKLTARRAAEAVLQVATGVLIYR